MSFVPLVEAPQLGKRIVRHQYNRDLLHHMDVPSNFTQHTGKRVCGLQKPKTLDDELARGRKKTYAAVDSKELVDHSRRSQTSMEPVEYKPLDARADARAQKFEAGHNSLQDIGVGIPYRPGLRLAPLPPPPPMECEIPGFKHMGNPILVAANERPNRAAAEKTNALRAMAFFGERKNQSWSTC